MLEDTADTSVAGTIKQRTGVYVSIVLKTETGAMSFSLKRFAEAMRELNMIETIWSSQELDASWIYRVWPRTLETSGVRP